MQNTPVRHSAGERPKKILLVAVTRMGDLLQASPSIVGLKEEYPGCHITVAIEMSFREICEGIPGIDEIYEFDLSFLCRSGHQGQVGIVEAVHYVNKKVEELRAKSFDICVNMSSAAYTALLLKMLDIPQSRGWISDDEGHRLITDPWAMLFAAYIFHANREYNSLNLVDIFRCASGAISHPLHLCYNASKQAKDFPSEFCQRKGIGSDGPLICIQAGASQEKRQWSVASFAEVTKYLVETLGCRVVFTGSRSEIAIFQQINALYSHPRVASAVGETKLGELGALLESADLLITGDTGTMHLSIAVGTPVISLFLASALGFETGPYGEGNIVIQPQISCNPCNPNYPCSRPDCHDQIPPRLVSELARVRLSLPPGERPATLPHTLAHPDEVQVYWSSFDEDGFLQFERISHPGQRHGASQLYYDCIRDAYRELWKTELHGVRRPPRTPAPVTEAHPLTKAIATLQAEIAQARTAVSRLLGYILDPRCPPRLLGEANAEIHECDRKIEEISLVNPPLGAIVRMFIMAKENLRGEDAVDLVHNTDALYLELSTRTEKFNRLFAEAWTRRPQSESRAHSRLPVLQSAETSTGEWHLNA